MGQGSTCANMPVCYSPIGMFDILIVTIINWIMRNIMGQVVRANTSVCYSPTGMFDILIVTIINWIMKTIME